MKTRKTKKQRNYLFIMLSAVFAIAALLLFFTPFYIEETIILNSSTVMSITGFHLLTDGIGSLKIIVGDSVVIENLTLQRDPYIITVVALAALSILVLVVSIFIKKEKTSRVLSITSSVIFAICSGILFACPELALLNSEVKLPSNAAIGLYSTATLFGVSSLTGLARIFR